MGIRFRYNSVGQLTAIRDGTGKAVTLHYNREGMLDSIRYPATPVARDAMFGPRGLPHHRQFGPATMARRSLHGPWPLTPGEAQFVACVSANWMSAEVQGHLASAQILTGDLGGLFGLPTAVAVTVAPSTIIISGGPGDNLLGSIPAQPFALIMGHEVGHILQYRDLGVQRFNQIWATEAGMQQLQNQADAYADANTARSGPSCR